MKAKSTKQKADKKESVKIQPTAYIEEAKNSRNGNLKDHRVHTLSKSFFDTNISLLGKQIGENMGKKTLVLDLDETLVHSTFGKDSNPE